MQKWDYNKKEKMLRKNLKGREVSSTLGILELGEEHCWLVQRHEAWAHCVASSVLAGHWAYTHDSFWEQPWQPILRKARTLSCWPLSTEARTRAWAAVGLFSLWGMFTECHTDALACLKNLTGVLIFNSDNNIVRSEVVLPLCTGKGTEVQWD